ncbi:MAG: hypothetical protein R3194_05970 [Limnobacter sp.]|nr:hypothetical protein [Limnobacter sp.]
MLNDVFAFLANMGQALPQANGESAGQAQTLGDFLEGQGFSQDQLKDLGLPELKKLAFQVAMSRAQMNPAQMNPAQLGQMPVEQTGMGAADAKTEVALQKANGVANEVAIEVANEVANEVASEAAGRVANEAANAALDTDGLNVNASALTAESERTKAEESRQDEEARSQGAAATESKQTGAPMGVISVNQMNATARLEANQEAEQMQGQLAGVTTQTGLNATEVDLQARQNGPDAARVQIRAEEVAEPTGLAGLDPAQARQGRITAKAERANPSLPLVPQADSLDVDVVNVQATLEQKADPKTLLSRLEGLQPSLRTQESIDELTSRPLSDLAKSQELTKNSLPEGQTNGVLSQAIALAATAPKTVAGTTHSKPTTMAKPASPDLFKGAQDALRLIETSRQFAQQFNQTRPESDEQTESAALAVGQTAASSPAAPTWGAQLGAHSTGSPRDLMQAVQTALKTMETRLPGKVDVSLKMPEGNDLKMQVQATRGQMVIDFQGLGQNLTHAMNEQSSQLQKTLETMGYQLQTVRINGEVQQAMGAQANLNNGAGQGQAGANGFEQNGAGQQAQSDSQREGRSGQEPMTQTGQRASGVEPDTAGPMLPVDDKGRVSLFG